MFVRFRRTRASEPGANTATAELRGPTDNCTDTSTDFADLLRARIEMRLATSREMI